MAQFKSVEIALTVKLSALSGTARDREEYPSRSYVYTETIDNVPSVKYVTDTIVCGLMEALVSSQSVVSYYDPATGVRVKVDYSIKARSCGSVTASGVSKEDGAKAVQNGLARGKKLSKNARKRIRRAALAAQNA